MTIEKLYGPNIHVELDASQIFPNDPGQGTPVLIVLSNGETASWNCGCCEGETSDGTKFTDGQCDWLAEIHEEVEAWMEEHSL
jgi:hypothetical protein